MDVVFEIAVCDAKAAVARGLDRLRQIVDGVQRVLCEVRMVFAGSIHQGCIAKCQGTETRARGVQGQNLGVDDGAGAVAIRFAGRQRVKFGAGQDRDMCSLSAGLCQSLKWQACAFLTWDGQLAHLRKVQDHRA